MSVVFGMRQELVSLFSGVKDVSSALLFVNLDSEQKARSKEKCYYASAVTNLTMKRAFE